MSKRNWKHVPKEAVPRGGGRIPTIPPQEVQQRPSWRFSGVDVGGPFKWPKGKDEELEILQCLHNFDSMTWREIEGPEHHSIEVVKLAKDARDRLKHLKQDDVDALFSFRCSGKKRIFGIRIEGLVRLLWWDPEHAACPAKLKHT